MLARDIGLCEVHATGTTCYFPCLWFSKSAESNFKSWFELVFILHFTVYILQVYISYSTCLQFTFRVLHVYILQDNVYVEKVLIYYSNALRKMHRQISRHYLDKKLDVSLCIWLRKDPSINLNPTAMKGRQFNATVKHVWKFIDNDTMSGVRGITTSKEDNMSFQKIQAMRHVVRNVKMECLFIYFYLVRL